MMTFPMLCVDKSTASRALTNMNPLLYFPSSANAWVCTARSPLLDPGIPGEVERTAQQSLNSIQVF